MNPGYDAPESSETSKWALANAMDAREWCMTGLEVPVNMTFVLGAAKAVTTLAAFIMYGDMCHRMTYRRVTHVDVDRLVDQWVESLIVMSTTHDPEERTRMDETTDELMRPLLTAPIAEVRDLARKVAKRLEEDSRVPYLVWTSFKKLVEPLVLKGPDGKEVQLQEVLAMEVANLVVPRLDPQELVKAMAGALQWRGPSSLEAVKEALGAPGAPEPKLRGRQSCLFLTVVDNKGEELAEVVL